MHTDPDFQGLKRKVRLILLLDAVENAGLSPIPLSQLHSLAYLSNVLAPVWNMPALDGKVLKKNGGPFYPALQRDLDQLIGIGVAVISSVGHEQDVDGNWRLKGKYRLNRMFSDKIVCRIEEFEDERKIRSFIQELAFALSALSDQEIDVALHEDATYSNPNVGIGNVVDFAEWQKKNYSANVARHFENLLPGGSKATPGEQLHLYLLHLQARIHGEQ